MRFDSLVFLVSTGLVSAACSGGSASSVDGGLADSGADRAANDTAGTDVPLSVPDSGAGGYRATMYIGGYDRLTIERDDPAGRRCFQILLLQPVMSGLDAGAISVSLPAAWGVQSFGVKLDVASCDSTSGVALTPCTGLTGSVSLPGTICTTVDFDLEMVCPTVAGGAATTTERMQAPGVAVEGC